MEPTAERMLFVVKPVGRRAFLAEMETGNVNVVQFGPVWGRSGVEAASEGRRRMARIVVQAEKKDRYILGLLADLLDAGQSSALGTANLRREIAKSI